MRRLKIAVDVDDVLAENAAGFVAFSNQRWDTSLTIDDYDEHWAKLWQDVDDIEARRRADEFHCSGVVRGYGYIKGGYEALTRLSRHHQLVVVTSRRLQIKADTLAWIDKYFPGMFTKDMVYFAGIWDKVTAESHMLTKANLIDRIDADVLIDDQLKHCLAVAETGRQALLFGDYKWNRSDFLPYQVRRCFDWASVEQEIDRIANID